MYYLKRKSDGYYARIFRCYDTGSSSLQYAATKSEQLDSYSTHEEVMRTFWQWMEYDDIPMDEMKALSIVWEENNNEK